MSSKSRVPVQILSLVACSCLGNLSASAQGMMEMGAVNSMSAGLGAGLMKNGVSGALGRSFSSSASSLNAVGDAGSSLDYGGPRVNVQAAGKESNRLFDMGRQKEKAGKYLEAEKYYRQSLYIREQVWADRDPNVPKLIQLIGDMCMKHGNLKEADNCYHRSMASALTRYGVGTYELAEPLSKLGAVSMAEKKYQDAANYYQQVYMLRSRKFSDGSPQTAEAAVWLGKAYLNSDCAPEAGELLKRVIDSRAADNGPQMVALLDLYGQALRKQNKNDDAVLIEARLQALRPAAPAAASTTVTESTAATTTAPGASSGSSSATKTTTSTATTTSGTTTTPTASSTPTSSSAAPVSNTPLSTSTPVLNVEEKKVEKSSTPKTTTEVKTEVKSDHI